METKTEEVLEMWDRSFGLRSELEFSAVFTFAVFVGHGPPEHVVACRDGAEAWLGWRRVPCEQFQEERWW